ncbi:hypothetical protein FEM21_13210 [Flavobacterium seoulense]|uniref:Uncharacterized protein n=1 Tax=Flavobacterium seoulense TaxID=1492738 RepID=A0A066WSJ8_9FLAO|nr:hypothetical protein FEM21_13210 [Flavobacterium seoulense]
MGNNPNYTVTKVDGTLTVTPKAIDVVVTADNKTKVYGEQNPVLTAVVTGAVAGGDAINYTLATTATQFSNVGSYPIEVTLGNNPNYTVTKVDGTLTVTSSPIDANDDIAGPVNGIQGGNAGINILSNDYLNGSIVNPLEITTSFVSSTNSGITLVGTDVVVAAGTPAGNYELVYKICENINLTTNCDQAIVKVSVYNPSIAITKEGNYIDTNNDGKANIGDQIKYTFIVKNTGGSKLTNITITDNKVTVIGGPIDLNVNESDTTTFSAIYNITQEDINKGVVYNLATAKGIPPAGDPVTATSTDPTPCTTCPKDPVCTDCTITEIPQNPGISITKDGTYVDTNNDGKTNIGDVVTYKFVIKNTGNVTLTNVTVTDNNAVVTGGPIATLAPGATDATTFTASHAITQDDINKGIVYNLATATAKDPKDKPVTATSTDPTPCTTCPKDPECTNCTITEIPQNPGISITKDGTYVDTNQDGKTNVGDVVSYKFVIKNTGNVTLTNVTVTDNNAVVTGGPIATLAPGATDATTFTASHTITQDDINKGIVYNLATATAKDPKDNPITATSTDPTPCTTCPKDPVCTDCTITELTQTPKIALMKTASIAGTGIKGDVITYTFTVTNTGNTTLTNVVVTDPMVGLTITGSPIATLAAGASSSVIKGTYTITQADVDAGKVTNTALATAKDPKGNNVTDISGTTVENDTPTVTIVVQTPKIALVKTASIAGTGIKGDVITYTFTVTNTGNTTLTNVVVTDPMVGLTITGSPIATLAAGASSSVIKGTYTITQADVDAGKVTNTALATAKDPKGNNVTDISGTTVENDTPTVTIVAQTPKIALVKTASIAGTGVKGDVITYTFTVTNTGNTTLTNIVVTDTMVGLTITGNSIATLAAGASSSVIKGTYTITQTDIDAGKVTNTALATAKDPKGNNVTDISGTTVDNDTPTTTPLTQNPGMTLVKTANKTNYDTLDEIITYTIVVTNTGNVTLHQVVVSDPLTGLNSTIGNLAIGESKEFTENYRVSQSDLGNENISNTATVNALSPNNTPVSGSDTVIVERAFVLGCGTIVVHNAFTPNGDGTNEVFKIDNIEDTLCYPENSVEIYNRWGILVYETKGYNNDSKAFRGFSEGRVTVDKSAGLPTGTYFYILNYTSVGLQGEIIPKKQQGYLYLTR